MNISLAAINNQRLHCLLNHNHWPSPFFWRFFSTFCRFFFQSFSKPSTLNCIIFVLGIARCMRLSLRMSTERLNNNPKFLCIFYFWERTIFNLASKSNVRIELERAVVLFFNNLYYLFLPQDVSTCLCAATLNKNPIFQKKDQFVMNVWVNGFIGCLLPYQQTAKNYRI